MLVFDVGISKIYIEMANPLERFVCEFLGVLSGQGVLEPEKSEESQNAPRPHTGLLD